MNKERRYECFLRYGIYSLKINVIASRKEEAEKLARERATEYLRNYRGVTDVAETDMKFDGLIERGKFVAN